MGLETTPQYFDKPTAIFLPFAKVDKANRMVYGFASTETLDSDGEYTELQAIKDALPDYMRFANIREMHGSSAVGKAREVSIMTKGGKEGLYVGAKVVDNDAWAKVLEEVYLGFSIGGKKLEKRGNAITKIHLSEISLVDRPANPDCTFDQVAKMHKIVERSAEVNDKLAKAAQEDFKVQTLIFSKDTFKVAGAAEAWARKNGFEVGSVDGSGETFRLQQFDLAKSTGGSMRTFEIADGVRAVGCRVSTVSALAKAAKVSLGIKMIGMALMKSEIEKGGPGSGPQKGGGRDTSQRMPTTGQRFNSDQAKANTENWTREQHVREKEEHLVDANRAKVAENREKLMAQTESDRSAREKHMKNFQSAKDAVYHHQEAAAFHANEARLKTGKVSKGTDTLTNAPGGNAGRKEDATMAGMTKEQMDAHKATHEQIGKELAEMLETHKDDSAMCEMVKAAMAEHDKVGKLFGKPDEAPPTEDKKPTEDGPKEKVAALVAKLAEMAGAGKAEASAATDEMKTAAEMIGNLAKAVGIVNDKVDALAKRAPEAPKTRLFSFGKTDELKPELLAKVETAAKQAEADKDPVALLKMVHSGVLGGVQIGPERRG